MADSPDKAALAQQLADIAAALAAEKAAIAEEAAAKKAAIAAGAAAQSAAIASRLQQEKAVQQAILAAQRNAAEASASFDKHAHELKLAQIKSESASAMSEAKRVAAVQASAAKPAAGGKPLLSPDMGKSFLDGLIPGASNLTTAAGLAGAAGGVIAAAATKLMDASIALAKGAADLAVSAGELAVAQTSKKEVQGAVGGKLGGSYEETVKMALKMGLDPDDAWLQTKKLLNAKFSKDEIPTLLKIKAGMDLAGLDGDALLKKLETIKLEPKVKSKDIDGLAKLGVDTKAVYAELAKEMGISVPAAMAKVKNGTADSAAVVKAIESVATKGFGGIADTLAGSTLALAARVKGDFMEMFSFDPAVMEPIKNALKSVAEVMEGPVGTALKGALQDVFKAVADLFGGINQGDVEAFLKPIVADFKELAKGVNENAPGLKKFGAAVAAISGEAIHWVAVALGYAIEMAAGAGVIFDKLSSALGAFDDASTSAQNSANAFGDSLGALSVDGVIDSIESLGTTIEDAASSAFADAIGVGSSLVDGIVQGIEDGASAAITAASDMASKALAAAKAVLGVASPSQEFAEVGHFSTEGMAKGLAANDNATKAAGDMGSKALGAAAAASGGGAAGGAGGAGAAGGGGGGISITINIGAGVTPAAAAAVKAALAEELPKLEAMLRRVARDQAEGKAAA